LNSLSFILTFFFICFVPLSYSVSSEIAVGLKGGDFVITFGFQNLADGQTVTVSEDAE